MITFLLIGIPALVALFLFIIIKLEGRNHETWV